MRPKDFKRWRKSLGLSQKEAAENLGLKRRVVQYYEKGERDGKDVDIPKSVRLACYALAEGISDYHGPREHGRDTLRESEAASSPPRKVKDRSETRLSLIQLKEEVPSPDKEKSGLKPSVPKSDAKPVKTRAQAARKPHQKEKMGDP